jgi:allantoin racemase
VATLELLAERAEEFDGVVLACFGDPGLYAARELCRVPVVGIAEAAMLTACTVAHRFSVVSTLARVRPAIEDLVARYGLRERCASVRTTPLAVLDIDRDRDAAERAIAAEGRQAIEDGAEAILLGCAGMGPLDRRVGALLPVPVIDGVAAGVKMVEGLVDLGLASSRAAAFKEPEPKELKGTSDVLRAFSARVPA